MNMREWVRLVYPSFMYGNKYSLSDITITPSYCHVYFTLFTTQKAVLTNQQHSSALPQLLLKK